MYRRILVVADGSANSKKGLANALDLAREHDALVRVLNADTSSYLTDVILRDAADWKADLIVMGSQSRRGLSRLFVKSHAERVLRKAPVSVLLITDDEDEKRPAPQPRFLDQHV